MGVFFWYLSLWHSNISIIVMIKYLLLALLVSTVLSNPFKNKCFLNLHKGMKSLQTALSMEVSDKKIDALTESLQLIPSILDSCLTQKMESKFNEQLPETCIADLNKAAKLSLKMKNEKDTNQLIYMKDLFLIQRLFQNKLKKECPFLENLTLEDLKDKATCMEDSYRLSLVVQQLFEDLSKNDKKQAVHDADIIFTTLPNVLDTCGQHEWANAVRKYLPMDCVHAIEDFIGELGVIEHNYTHFEWLIKNYKSFEVYLDMIKMHCPLVHEF